MDILKGVLLGAGKITTDSCSDKELVAEPDDRPAFWLMYRGSSILIRFLTGCNAYKKEPLQGPFTRNTNIQYVKTWSVFCLELSQRYRQQGMSYKEDMNHQKAFWSPA